MKSYYQDNNITIYNKDCRDMSELVDNSVQCVVTSPPYWGLRKYSGEQDLIWGDNHCEHDWLNAALEHDNLRFRGENALTGENKNPAIRQGKCIDAGYCSLCGAWRGSFGLEPTPEMYVQHTIEILREIRRVLRKDGVVFWNIGDSYWGGKGQSGQQTPEYQLERFNKGKSHNRIQLGGPGLTMPKDGKHSSIKPKDLCLIPFRVALEAQFDGWWVRSVIIWSKPNPMPESVTDRPTESHEYILMLTKSARYYWDQEAVREQQTMESLLRLQRAHSGYDPGYPSGPQNHISDYFKKHEGMSIEEIIQSVPGRNLRSVWSFPTQPGPSGAVRNFAVFPEKLPELCIKAASKIDDIVLDPFAGAGTTLWVAKKLNRQAVGYDLSMEYCDLALGRNRQQALNLASESAL